VELKIYFNLNLFSFFFIIIIGVFLTCEMSEGVNSLIMFTGLNKIEKYFILKIKLISLKVYKFIKIENLKKCYL
jgi:hypothetical protein